MNRCVLAIVTGVFLALGSSLGADDKPGKINMDGTWIPTSAEIAGKKFPEDILKTMKLTVKEAKYTVVVGKVMDEGTLKHDLTAKPMTVDIVGTEGPNKGKTILAIFELDGDTLKVCYDLSGKARPTAFETKADSQLFLVTYKREKP